MKRIKKIFLSIIAAITLSITFVTPLMSMTKTNNTVIDTSNSIEKYNEEISEEEYILYTEEEVFETNTDENDIHNDNTEEDQEIKDTTIYQGWTTTKLNIREEPNTEATILDILDFNEEINFQLYNDEWVIIQYNNEPAYVYKKYITQDRNDLEVYLIPQNTGFKSYMSYKAITNKSSKQYKLQQKAYTGNYGIRMVDDRYCVALGTYFQKEIGTYFDLVLENGTIIKCILGDIKANVHTKEDNITSLNGCVSEFIIDSESLVKIAKTSGDISSCNDRWKSPVEKIIFFNQN